ncbi:hypothetical protein GH714_019564 [Hevea brasiliensis]|uniref:Gfo/Idh/MocA-like oxidoreductase N-terminal domain-containing protein n=1 Tax=Hevea brasiliensis TaxID=3981 RepID=A0A6A6KSL8_HEVBR|nr:hypothetical protein GH714_019302 [Hevea brasiliensis]KAF2291069.1 hypothetical protein GH714_019564 [Hevea brasiliensis]
MAETVIRFGIIGCAEIARKISRAIILAPNAQLSAVASRSVEKAAAFAKANNFPPPDAKIYGSYESLLDDPDIDAVYVPLPTSLHVKWACLVAQKKKHILLEKPVGLNVGEFDKILDACEIHSTFTFAGDEDFLKNDIRVKPDLDGLGALGDAGWYPIRAILWAADYELPKTVIALRGPVLNEAGVILACGASLHWEDGKVATLHCSFLTHLTMFVTAIGTKGTLHVDDFIVPFNEKEAPYATSSKSWFNELVTGWEPLPSQNMVFVDLPQEACMVREFARLVGNIKVNGAKPDQTWPTRSRKTQLILDAVKTSIERGFEPVEIAN